MSLSAHELALIQSRSLTKEFSHDHNAPIPKSMDAVRAFERAGTRVYGAPKGETQKADKWVGIYSKESVPAPTAE